MVGDLGRGSSRQAKRRDKGTPYSGAAGEGGDRTSEEEEGGIWGQENGQKKKGCMKRDTLVDLKERGGGDTAREGCPAMGGKAG